MFYFLLILLNPCLTVLKTSEIRQVLTLYKRKIFCSGNSKSEVHVQRVSSVRSPAPEPPPSDCDWLAPRPQENLIGRQRLVGVSGCRRFATVALLLLQNCESVACSLYVWKMANVDLAQVGKNALKSETGEVSSPPRCRTCSVCSALNGSFH